VIADAHAHAVLLGEPGTLIRAERDVRALLRVPLAQDRHHLGRLDGRERHVDDAEQWGVLLPDRVAQVDLAAGDRKRQAQAGQQVLDIAASLALAESAELHVAHAWKAIPEDVMRGSLFSTPHEIVDAYLMAERNRRSSAMESALADLGRRIGDDAMRRLTVLRHLPKGWARDELPLVARRIGADIIVLGTLARTGVPGLLMGNTAEAILHQIDCSVLALKPLGFETPVR
jgi:nucleotide-binding universal stress UspA family protein